MQIEHDASSARATMVDAEAGLRIRFDAAGHVAVLLKELRAELDQV